MSHPCSQKARYLNMEVAINKMNDFVFILLRHVNYDEANLFWQEAYTSIRKFYNNKIIILDNSSNKNLIKTNINLVNCEIIDAKYPQNRLYSPLYYFLTEELDYSKAVIIHDGFIFNDYIDFNQIEDVKFFWHFGSHCPSQKHREVQQLNVLKNNEELFKLYNSNEWKGCLGCALVISKKFINTLDEKFNLKSLTNIINDQEDAISFERILAILCCKEKPSLINDPSILGDVSEMAWGYRWHQYVSDRNNNTLPNKKILKIFAARK